MTEITVYDDTIEKLELLESNYGDVEVDLSTAIGTNQAQEAARKFQKLRVGIEKIRTEANEEARNHIKAVNDKAKAIQARIQPLEERFAKPLKEKKERDKKVIAEIEERLIYAQNASVASIQESIDWIVRIDPQISKEVAKAIRNAKVELSEALEEAIEKEALKLKREEEQKELAVNYAIESIKSMVHDAFDWKQGRIKKAIDYLEGMTFDDEDYNGRAQEAEQVKQNVIHKLTKLYTTAEPDEVQPKSTLSKRDETLNSLLFLLDGDLKAGNDVLDAIIEGRVPNVKFMELEEY